LATPLAMPPKLIVHNEPTSALNVGVWVVASPASCDVTAPAVLLP
jgi:hypothetical protein